MSGSRLLSILGVIVGVFGAIAAQLTIMRPAWAGMLVLIGLVLTALNERLQGGKSTVTVEEARTLAFERINQ